MPRSIANSKKPGITIRDGVHRDIDFTPLESDVIDTPQIQRLRNIKQLGFTYLVYPSATHTRFEHSIGTCFLTGVLLDRIAKNIRRNFSRDERQIARAFAIVHDASHIPFGHTLEDEHNVFRRHDKGARLLGIVDQPELKKALDIYYEPVRAIVEHISNPRNKYIHPSVESYLPDIVAGTIGADLLDYLQRDNLFTGLRREYDPRVFNYFSIRDHQLVIDLTKHDMIRPDAVSDVMDLLRMRYTLTEKVYYHHTKLAFGAVLAKAIRIAQEEKLINEQMLTEMGDWDLLHYLSEDSKLPKAVRTLVDRITPRGIYRRAYELPRRHFGAADEEFSDFVSKYRTPNSNELVDLEKAIAKAANVPFEDVVVYCPSRQMQLKEATVPAYVGSIVPLIDLNGDDSKEAELYYEKFKQLWTFYVFSFGDHQIAMKVGNAAKEILEKPNYYDPAL